MIGSNMMTLKLNYLNPIAMAQHVNEEGRVRWRAGRWSWGLYGKGYDDVWDRSANEAGNSHLCLHLLSSCRMGGWMEGRLTD